MNTTSQHRKPLTGLNHAMIAACLSALVMMTILLVPTVTTVLGNYQITPDSPTEPYEYTVLDEQIATGYFVP